MKKYTLVILYITIIFSLVFGGTGTLRIGPFSLRHICTLCLILYQFNWIGKRRVVFFPVLKFYLVYLMVYIAANLLNGEATSSHFAQSIYTYHLPSLVILLTFPILIKDEQRLSLITKAIVGIYLFNAIITFFQYLGSPLAWDIGRTIADISEDKEASLDYVNNSSDILLGYALASGIIGFAVTNGYIMATFFPLLLRHFYEKISSAWIWDGLFASVALLAAFAIQQRIAFFLVALYIAFIAFVRANKVTKVLVLLVLLFLIGGNINYNVASLGRLHDLGDGLETREVLLANFVSFLNSPFMLFGGYDTYSKNFGMGQHNAFLSAWTIGGVFTFLCFTLFFFYLSKLIFVGVRSAVKQLTSHIYTIVYGSSSGIFLIYSLFHSAGVQNGSPMFWISFTLFLISNRIENKREYDQKVI